VTTCLRIDPASPLGAAPNYDPICSIALCRTAVDSLAIASVYTGIQSFPMRLRAPIEVI
jgi:hypothetical protein